MTAPPPPQRPLRPLRILHAGEQYHPTQGGIQTVLHEVGRRLARRGHHVTTATSHTTQRQRYHVDGVDIVGFEISGNLVEGLRGPVDRYQRFLMDGNFDVFMAYAAQQWTVDAAWPLFDRLPAASVLAPCGFSGLSNPRYADYFARLPRLLRRCDRLIFHSDTYQDRAFCDGHGLQDISHTIPNGADGESFPAPDPARDAEQAAAFRKRHGIPPEGPLLLTVGTHTGMKGHDCTLAAFRRMTTRPAHLLIAANGSPGVGCHNACQRGVRRATRGNRTARTLNLARDQVVAAFRAADLFLFPSRIECSPVVLYEAAAAGLPFIASPAGNAQEIAAWSGGGQVVPATGKGNWWRVAPRDLAHAADTLLADPDRRAAMSAAGRAAFEARFDWERITDRYEAVYREAIAARAAR